MESWENKILRDKIDGLQGLPAHYSPDLSSKWEIIEAGLPQQEKRIISLLIRWSVAAAIFACAIVAGIKITASKKKSDEMMASVKMPLHIPIVVQKEQTITVTKPAIVKRLNDKLQEPLTIHHSLFTKAAPIIEIIAKQDKEQSIDDELKTDQVILLIDSATIGNVEIVMIPPQFETPKRVKRSTFQKDFNDGLLIIDTSYSKPAGTQFSFKFQLHKPTGDEAQPSRHLQFKQVL